jgi:hypothetical protein
MARMNLVDRLAERGLIDRWGFMVFALGGAGAILIAKSTGLPPVLVAAAAAITMVFYAAVVQFKGTGRLGSDQAGDNCYYLGLIYTLTSLAYAIFLFDPANTATTIVQGFGIALATTIMGLILRVFFNQTRADLVQTEDTARLELADAAGRLKAELSATVVSMNDFGRRTRQSLEELSEAVIAALEGVQSTATSSLGEAIAQTARSIRDVGDEAMRSVADTAARAAGAIGDTATQATQAVAEQTNEAVARAKRLSTATDKVVSGIEKHVAMLGVVDQTTAGITAGLTALESAAVATRESMDTISARAREVDKAEADVAGAGRELRDVTAQLAGHLQGFDGAAERFDALIAARLEEVRRTPGEMAMRAADEVQRAAASIRSSLEELAVAQGEATAILVRGANEGAATMSRHNEALEVDLARSRENVAKVHSALVAMTDDLAAHVEAKVG